MDERECEFCTNVVTHRCRIGAVGQPREADATYFCCETCIDEVEDWFQSRADRKDEIIRGGRQCLR